MNGNTTDSDLVEERELQEGEGCKEDSKVLTEKAVRLLRVIAEHGYLTINEVGFIYKHQTHAYRLIKGLKGLDLLGEFDTTLRPRTGYFLKPKGYRVLRDRGELRLKRRFDPREYKSFIFTHRMACAKVGVLLEDHPLVTDFLPESLLWERRKGADQKLCDGEFLFKAPSWERARRVGLEIELTLKNSEKLRESFQSFIERQDLDQVWWVCGTPAIAKALGYWIGRLRERSRQQHFLCMLEAMLATQHRLELHDRQGQVFSISPEAPTLPEVLEPEPPPPPVAPEAPPTPAPAAPPPPQPAVDNSPFAVQSRRDLWRTRFHFTRWREFWTMIAVLTTWLGLLAGDHWLSWQESKGWRERLLLRSEVRDRRWLVRPLFLASKGHQFKLGLAVFNTAETACRLRSVRLHASGRVEVSDLVLPKRDGTIAAGSGLMTRHLFEAPPSSRRFLAIYTVAGSRDCPSAVVPIVFK